MDYIMLALALLMWGVVLLVMVHEQVRLTIKRWLGVWPRGGDSSYEKWPQYMFFLGGKDLEMITIRKLLRRLRLPSVDKGLGWGAKASEYRSLIGQVARQGFVPVLIELEVDFDLPPGTVVIDHHGANAHRRASIIQVLDLLNVPPTRWQQFVAANDSGSFWGLRMETRNARMIRKVLAADRRAQGITRVEEAQAVEALAAKEPERVGEIRVVRLPHARKATVTDVLSLQAMMAGKYNPEQHLILSFSGEVNFQGNGLTAKALNGKFPGGWSGGMAFGTDAEPAYWGGFAPEKEVLDFLRQIQTRSA